MKDTDTDLKGLRRKEKVMAAARPGMTVTSVLSSLDTRDDPDEDLTLPRFVMDFSMFRVAKQLRLLGYDVVCDQRLRSEQLITVAAQQHRVLVSGSRFLAPQADRYNRLIQRDRQRRQQGVPKTRKIVGYNSDGESEYEASSGSGSDDEPPLRVIQVKATDPHDVTLRTVMQQMALEWCDDRIFSRCVTCNRLIKPVEKAQVDGLVHPTVFRVYRHFYQCGVCKKVYWGVDNGVIVNYKAMRTIEYLKRYCAGEGGSIDSGLMMRDAESKVNSALMTPSASSDGVDSTTTKAEADGLVMGLGMGPHGGGGSMCSSSSMSSNRRRLCMRRHFMAYPRSVKCRILDYLEPEELSRFEEAFPMLSELITIVRSGAPRRFVPEWRMKDKHRCSDIHDGGDASPASEAVSPSPPSSHSPVFAQQSSPVLQ